MSKHYEVVGTQPILGHLPGEKFVAKIDEAQEAFLIQIGGLKVLPKPKKGK